MKKRITSIILSIMIVFGVVVSDYQTVMAIDIPTAFWGTLEASRAFFTALYAGGALDHGISLSDFTASNQREWLELAPRVMEAYQAFCFYKEKIIVSAENPSWSTEQINSESMSRALVLKNRFNENAITVSGNTTGQITAKDWGYWREFCKEFSAIALNGIGSSDISSNTPVSVTIRNNGSGLTTPKVDITNIYGNTLSFQNNNYIYKGKYNSASINNSEIKNNINEIEVISTDSSRVIIPFIIIQNDLYNNRLVYKLVKSHYKILTGEFMGSNDDIWNIVYYSSELRQGVVNEIINNSEFPIVLCTNSNYSETYNGVNENILSIKTNINSSPALDWQYGIQNAVDSNKAGESIKNGTKENSVPLVRDNSIPIKRSSLKEEEKDGQKVVSGVIGWDIPETKVIEGTIADPRTEDDYKRATGVIDVPIDDVIDYPDDVEVVIPDDAEIVRPDNPDLPIPITKLLQIQYGPFYPVAMDITEFFPFCIPFDIAYCINKFNVGEGTAPVLHIPIKYPNKLKATLGDSYDVVIDFNDYIALRNIIRYFILLLFIVGLMTITRNLIRG